MFIHFGNLFEGAFGSRRNNPIVSQYMMDAPGPAVISISQIEDEDGIVFTPEFVAEAMNIIYMTNKPVFVKIACSPSVIRPDVDSAVQDAINQINTIYDLFVGYNMLSRLGGFALNNIFFGELFNDESSWAVTKLNQVIAAAHAKNKSVMVLGDPAIAGLSKFNQPKPYNDAPAENNYLSANSLLGSNSGITDYIVHLNVLYPWHLYSPAYPELVFDLSRFASSISIMKTFTRTNLKHYLHQGHPQAPYPNFFQGRYDGILGPLTTVLHKDRIERTAQFIEAAGIVDYTLTHDTAYGAISNIALPPMSYRGSNTQAFYQNVSLISRNGIISILDGRDPSKVVERKFDSNLKEIV